MSEGCNESRKRNKKQYMSGHYHKRWKGFRELEVGMEGILITCNNNQKKCMAEALDLLNEYGDKLFGPEGDTAEEEDVDDALQREVAQLRSFGPQHVKRFQALDSGAHNVIFIRTQNLESDRLVHHILSDISSTKKSKSRTILRMLPVTGTCRAFEEDMLRYLPTFLEPWFKQPNCATYKIAFKSRNSSHNKRDDILRVIPEIVGRLNKKNKVNLTDPELTIILEVIKAVCCVSVVKDYRLYKKYNLQEVVKEDAPKPDVTSSQTEVNTTEQQKQDREEEGEKVSKEEDDEEETDVNKTEQQTRDPGEDGEKESTREETAQQQDKETDCGHTGGK
ncbi:THUMP domain-containing protein 1 isoform X2 [Gouania willdenowi]|uniref:THUMP domain-containing protein 1 isoform X2 n=1 Tax=Gouania willdenowi TaxID=441366 RepID=UPI0010543BF8|nr:THUMP domain-containing protein 1 isoform X2 [Gouania willdenowi]